jgi:threonine synthase
MKNSPLLFYSTNLQTQPVSFSQALMKGLAPDGGLFMPKTIPILSIKEIKQFSSMEYHEIAFVVTQKFLNGEISDDVLKGIVKNAYDYPVPLERVYENKFILRLDQGPTASFKDFAARMMGRLMQHYLKISNKNLLILTATSGDTGSAIANSFYGLDAIQVAVLFPEKEVTTRQRKQMTTLGKNVTTISVDGKFDDCQHLVKQAFSDPELDFLNLSSANSINIGRLIPQIVYYFYAHSRLAKDIGNEKTIVSVPSGNFGDMMGGLLAMKMGLPVKKFIIAVNSNDEFPKYLQTGIYNKIVPSLNCISSAMNVGHPSNLARVVALFGGIMDEKGNIHRQADINLMRKQIFSVSIDDVQTKQIIFDTWNKYSVLLEPHGSVAWAGLQHYLEKFPEENLPSQLCISLETAHPAKFPEHIFEITGINPALPPSLEGIESKTEFFDSLSNDYTSFKTYLLNKYNSR